MSTKSTTTTDLRSKNLNLALTERQDDAPSGWTTVPRFPNYEAHPLGLVRNAKTKRVLTQMPNSDGYLMLNLYHRVDSKNKMKSRRVHKIIAETFIRVYNGQTEKVCCDHINGDKKDNRASNLRLVDYATNARNARKGSSKRLTARQEQIIEQGLERGLSLRTIAKMAGCSHNTVYARRAKTL